MYNFNTKHQSVKKIIFFISEIIHYLPLQHNDYWAKMLSLGAFCKHISPYIAISKKVNQLNMRYLNKERRGGIFQKKNLLLRKFIEMGIFSFFSKDKKKELDQVLEKSKENFFSKLAKTIVGKSKVDDEVLDRLEELLVTSDVGVETTLKIIERIEKRVSNDKYISTSQLNTILRDEIVALMLDNNVENLSDFELPEHEGPYVIMVVGVNGVGKTTTIGKLAYQFKNKGYSVMLGAADTFRAAAVDQLEVWAERAGVPIVTQKMGSDPASVAYDTVASAIAKEVDVVIIDTAGRLHNKAPLMRELSKIKNVVQKLLPNAPQEILLVLDGSTGQNAIEQARQFTAATEVNALAITKLDGTAKGGVVIGISDQFSIPVKYIGLGERIDQLQVFNRAEFIDSLFPKNW